MNICEIDMNLVRWCANGNMYLLKGELQNDHYFVEEIYKDDKGKMYLSGIHSYAKENKLFDKKIITAGTYEQNKIKEDHEKLTQEVYQLQRQIRLQKEEIKNNGMYLKRTKFITCISESSQDQITKFISGNFEYIVSGIYIWDVNKALDDNRLKSVVITQDWDGNFHIKMGEYSDTSGHFKSDVYFAENAQDAADKLIENFNKLKHKLIYDYDKVAERLIKLNVEAHKEFNEEYKKLRRDTILDDIKTYNSRIKDLNEKLEAL